jgi:hypothetical protein
VGGNAALDGYDPTMDDDQLEGTDLPDTPEAPTDDEPTTTTFEVVVALIWFLSLVAVAIAIARPNPGSDSVGLLNQHHTRWMLAIAAPFFVTTSVIFAVRAIRASINRPGP